MSKMSQKGESIPTQASEATSVVDVSEALLLEVYHRLHERYGPQHWWPGESPLETVLGAILTQNTAWTNVEKALANLKGADMLSVQALRDVADPDLAAMLRPSGYFNAKARKVKAFINYLWDCYHGEMEEFLQEDTEWLREELLSIYGIGEETADDILLYAAGKPSFVIDAYTRRILERLALEPSDGKSYQAYQRLFHRNLPRDVSLYNEYHALLDRHGKETCKKEPLCRGCCLLELCPRGRLSIDTSNTQTL